MEYKNIRLTNGQNLACSLSNICGYWPKAADVMDVQNAVEDSTTPNNLCKTLNTMDLLKKPWVVDRETIKYLRFKHTDRLGNIDYLIIDK